MRRILAYNGEIPFTADILNTNRNLLKAMGLLAQDVLGSATSVSGLACSPTASPSLAVSIAAGRIYSMQTVDASAYSDVGTDTDQVIKQGISAAAVTLNCPAPVTTGQSINYLIEAQYQDSDTASTVLPYYNSLNPSSPLSGPGGLGASQATQRDGIISLVAKAGFSAVSGTQVTPSPDAGYVGLWVVTVVFGATSVVSGNIAQAVGAPFIGTVLTQALADARYLQQAAADARYLQLSNVNPATAAESGVTIVNSFYPTGYVDRYATNTTPGTTDMTGAFNKAALVASRLGCKVRWGATAPYALASPANFTGYRGIVFEDESAGNLSNNTPSIIIGHTGHGFDIATSTELTFNNVIASNKNGTVPKTLFFMARNAGGAGCGLHRFNNCRTAANSTFSWISYAYGAEENAWNDCEFYQNHAGSGIHSKNQTNPAGYTSSFVTIATGVQSNTEDHHYGFGYFNFGNSGSQNEVIWQLENTGNFTARDGTWGVAHGLAYVQVIGNTGSTNLTFDSIRGEPMGTQPLYGISVNNTAGTSVSWTFNNVTADAVNELLHFNAAQTPAIQNLAMRASTCTSGKLLAAYSMSNSLIESMILSIITGATGGAVSNNVFIGGRNNITLSGTAAQNTYIDNNTGTIVTGAIGLNGNTAPAQLTGWGTPTGATVQTNFSGSAATLPQCSAAIAKIISYLESRGDFGA